MIWIKEGCIREALKYSTISEWVKSSVGSYNSARVHGWFEECIAHMKNIKKGNGFWSKDNCISEATKFTTKSEWRTQSPSSYEIAKRMKWIEECSKHMVSLKKSNGFWTFDKIVAELKNGNKRMKFLAYKAAIRNGFLEKIKQMSVI